MLCSNDNAVHVLLTLTRKTCCRCMGRTLCMGGISPCACPAMWTPRSSCISQTLSPWSRTTLSRGNDERRQVAYVRLVPGLYINTAGIATMGVWRLLSCCLFLLDMLNWGVEQEWDK